MIFLYKRRIYDIYNSFGIIEEIFEFIEKILEYV